MLHVGLLKPAIRLLSTAALCAATATTHGADTAPSAGSDEAALQTLHQQIVKLIGEPRCVNVVHCRLLALGSRPCGGPSEYLAYSSGTGNREALEAKAYEYGFLEEEVNRARGAAGTCQVLPEPHVSCIDGRCTLSSERR
jgi:hypothetical protein